MAKGSNNQKRTLKNKIDNGEERTPSNKYDDYTLGEFTPTEEQWSIVDSIENNDLTVIDAPSGCGKSSTALWKALSEYRAGNYQKLVFIKNPTEAGDDQIGFLPNSAEDKIAVHMETMKTRFHQFMSKQKLENDCRSGNIVLTIPNFELGNTRDNTFIIIDEGQTMSSGTTKLVLERAGKNTKVVLIGDSKQCYSAKYREDGFRDFINKVTEEIAGYRVSKEAIIGYVRLESNSNMRSDLSKRITELYDSEEVEKE